MPSPKEPADRDLSPLEAAEALRWWIRSGVTDALDEEPHDRFVDSLARDEDTRSPSNAPAPTIPPSPPALEARPLRQEAIRAAMPPDAAETSARALAQSAGDLETLRSILADFDGCPLKRTATQLVFADGVPGSRV
ncbi:MAG TPA: uracil-DNA glycosylase, partial [Roseiarcus sp.]|nr:uracil-DNA glycosylase [Roseiarcus sp.]